MNATLEEIFEAIGEMKELYPDWRFGQLVCNVAFWARGPQVESIWDVEDCELLDTLRKHIAKRRKDIAGTASEVAKT